MKFARRGFLTVLAAAIAETARAGVFGFRFPPVPPAWTPLPLFAAAGGAWYDPSDLSSMFQDSAGTTPAVVGQPVGLLLDKSQGGLGSEIVTNGDFTAGSTGWTVGAGLVIAGGKATFTAATTNLQSDGGGYVTGKTYKVTFTVSGAAGGSVACWVRGTFGPTITTNGTFTQYVVAGSGSDLLLLSGSNFTGSVDDVSVKLAPGNHAIQATATARPILSARVNQFLATSAFADGAWNKVAGTVADNAAIAPDGTTTATLFTVTGSGNAYVNQSNTFANGNVLSVYAKAGTSANLTLAPDGSGPGDEAHFDLSAGTVVTAGTNNVSAAIASVGNGWYRCSVVRSTANPTQAVYIGKFSNAVAGDTLYLWHPQAQAGTAPLARYQRVNTATDYDATGFPLYLAFDGVDDYLRGALPSADYKRHTLGHATQMRAIPNFTELVSLGNTVNVSPLLFNYPISGLWNMFARNDANTGVSLQPPSTPDIAPHIHIHNSGAAARRYRVDFDVASDVPTVGPMTLDSVMLGARVSGAGAADYGAVNVYQSVLVFGELALAQEAQLATFLGTKAGLSL